MAGLKPVEVAAGVDPRRIDRRSGRPKRISSAVQRAIDLLLTGACTTQQAAAERVGLSEQHLSRAFKLPHIADFIHSETQAALSSGKLTAGARLLALLHSKSDHVSFDAARHTLAISGIAPPSDGRGVNININNNQIAAGYVIDMTPWTPISETERAKVVEHAAGPAEGIPPGSQSSDG